MWIIAALFALITALVIKREDPGYVRNDKYGKPRKIKSAHSLFFIHVDYWPYVLIAFGIYACYAEMQKPAGVSPASSVIRPTATGTTKQGTITMAGTADYQGNVVDGKATGHGVIVYHNGDRYQGQVSNGDRQGHGLYSSVTGATYEGEWVQGQRQGHGVAIENGNRYDGDWMADAKNGHGVLTTAKGVSYDGQWKNNDMYGEGVATWPNGDRYEGTWEYNQKNQGRIHFFKRQWHL